MTGKVFFSVTMSLDGYIAPESSPEDVEAWRRGGTTPGLERWMAQWGQLQSWAFEQRFFRENLKLGTGGNEGRDNAIVADTFQRTGASIMGKRMFELGEIAWPEEAPFHTPVYVLTHDAREPWPRPGGTTFHFVNDGIENAIAQARDAAGDRDVRIAGGGNTILQYLTAGLIDEFTIALAPVFFGSGVSLFDGIDADGLTASQVHVEPSSPITHLTYALGRS
jgi:dihydrofolate reductase